MANISSRAPDCARQIPRWMVGSDLSQSVVRNFLYFSKSRFSKSNHLSR